jgi:SpoVK/Ycf46/Vps4 family AAA+-type ATPase
LLLLTGDAHGFVGADLAALCREAALLALKRVTTDNNNNKNNNNNNNKTLQLCMTRSDFDVALRRVRPASLRSVAVR